MAIFDRLRGKRAESEESAAPGDASAAASVSPTLDLTEQAIPQQSDAAAKILGFNKLEAERLYNPYDGKHMHHIFASYSINEHTARIHFSREFKFLTQPSLIDFSTGLGAALDRRDVKGPFRRPKEPEFLFIEEAAAHRRSWSENLTYYTGVGYLTGAVIGGGLGTYRALTTPVTLATADGLPSQRLRVNQLLNTSGKLGRTAGNALGVVGLMFSSSESFLRYMNDGTVPDDAATLGAGALTGAIYRSVRGPRQALAAAAVGTFASAGLLAARNLINAGL